jgi:hypothetical protein
MRLMAKFVFLHSSPIVQALVDAGVIDHDQIDYIRRVVIDLEAGAAAKVYVERFADDERLIVGLRAGLQVAGSEEDAGRIGGA